MYSLIIPNLLGTALVPLVSLFFPKETVGLFAFGMVFYNGAVLIPNAFNSVLLPRLSEAIEKKQDLWKILGKTALQYTAIAVPAILLVFVLTQPILQIIAPAYSKGANITLALIIASILLGYLSLLGSYYTAQERVKANWIVTIARNLLLLAVSLMALFYF